MKKCNQCNQYKVSSAFHKNKNYNDGYQYDCKDCRRKAKQRWYKQTRSKRLEVMKKWKQNHKKDIAMYQKNWRQSDRGRILHRLHEAKRRHRILDTSDYQDELKIVEMWQKTTQCHYCNIDLTFEDYIDVTYATIDHIVPLSKGGTHTHKNIAIVCLGCNMSKGDKLISEWKGEANHGRT